MPAPCPTQFLRPGDRIEFAGRVIDMTAVHPLPGRVEVSFIGLDCVIGTDVWDPELEVTLIRTAAEAVPAW